MKTKPAIVMASLWLCASVFAQPQKHPKIASISVEAESQVNAPDGVTPINQYGGLSGLADEHSTILPPGTFPFQTDYLFMVASHTSLQSNEAGLVVLRSIGLPDSNGQWTLDYSPGYGRYQPSNPPGGQNGQLLLPAMAKANCPGSVQDPTFDLNYAAPGTVFLDPTNPWDLGGGSLVMVYEGTNTCIGTTTTTHMDSHFYSTLAIATSADFGHTWPTYKANFTPLPGANPSQGPMAELGAWGKDVCWGNFCSTINLLQPPPQFGRYAVSGPATSIASAILDSPGGLQGDVGDSEPAAFVDDVHPGAPLYAYIVHVYEPGPFPADTPLPLGEPSGLAVSRIGLDGGLERLQATHWYGEKFEEPGLANAGGGHESPIFPNLHPSLEGYQHCLAPTQRRSGASISYSEVTHEYVLIFVCLSQTDPVDQTGSLPTNVKFTGGAWFYSTMNADLFNLSNQDQWSTPGEIQGSWAPHDTNPCANGEYLDGWYPSAMSLGAKPGHLNPDGYIFYMKGCIAAAGRTFSTRQFTLHMSEP
jgi:hypothetical protein